MIKNSFANNKITEFYTDGKIIIRVAAYIRVKEKNSV